MIRMIVKSVIQMQVVEVVVQIQVVEAVQIENIAMFYIVVCEADLYILMLFVSQSVYLSLKR